MGEKASRGENRAEGSGWRVHKALMFDKENAEKQLLRSI